MPTVHAPAHATDAVKAARQPVDAREAPPTALALACSMAFLAGSVDVYGLTRLKLYVSFMSGNTTMLGIAIGHADTGRGWPIAGVVALFVAGAAIGAMVAERAGVRHATAVTILVAVLLVVPLLRPGSTAVGLVLAMGALNAAMNRVGGASVSLTYVTGTLAKLGQGVGGWLAGRRGGAPWWLQAAMWLSLLSGAVTATILQTWFGARALWSAPALALVLAGVTAAAPRGRASP